MGFEEQGETVTAAHELNDLKLVYRALHNGLRKHPELMETAFLSELQDFLHRKAVADGVDTTHHAAWDAWLAEALSRVS
ncbi:hypothetical protein Pan216_35090 [Planctomycetes bacterium Pan216]|uniref:Uncharacterized protein n=1 Tax=Kolteria novifilia TaxID=2527975 RepID=A0A518B6S2_9BACT|nr:hypothetical protein Pan216_35090 [Planctomycetes bacterium Pan216]